MSTDLEKLLQADICLRKKGPPLIKERINLIDVRSSYLVAKNLDINFMDEELLRIQFGGEKDNQVKSITFNEYRTEAEIKFMNHKGNLFSFFAPRNLLTEIARELPSMCFNVV